MIKSNQSGFSLLEILVALGIAAATIAVGANYLGNRPVRAMQEESIRLNRIIRCAYFQAAAKSLYYRLVFDLDENRYLVESSENPFYVTRENDEKEIELKKRQQEALENLSALDEPATPAITLDSKFSETEDECSEMVQLEGIRVADIYVMHQNNKQSEGKAYLYFFPRGRTEFAVIHLSDESAEEDFMTLIVNPLNASVEIRRDYIEHEDILEEFGGSS